MTARPAKKRVIVALLLVVLPLLGVLGIVGYEAAIETRIASLPAPAAPPTSRAGLLKDQLEGRLRELEAIRPTSRERFPAFTRTYWDPDRHAELERQAEQAALPLMYLDRLLRSDAASGFLERRERICATADRGPAGRMLYLRRAANALGARAVLAARNEDSATAAQSLESVLLLQRLTDDRSTFGLLMGSMLRTSVLQNAEIVLSTHPSASAVLHERLDPHLTDVFGIDDVLTRCTGELMHDRRWAREAYPWSQSPRRRFSALLRLDEKLDRVAEIPELVHRRLDRFVHGDSLWQHVTIGTLQRDRQQTTWFRIRLAQAAHRQLTGDATSGPPALPFARSPQIELPATCRLGTACILVSGEGGADVFHLLPPQS